MMILILQIENEKYIKFIYNFFFFFFFFFFLTVIINMHCYFIKLISIVYYVIVIQLYTNIIPIHNHLINY